MLTKYIHLIADFGLAAHTRIELIRQEPENIDKEFLRLWFAKNCDPYNDEVLPDAPDVLV